LNDYNDLTDQERLFYVEEMKKSAEVSHNLLQNLLQWSRSQTGRIEFRPASVNLKKIINMNIELVRAVSEKKQISVSSNLIDDTFVFADEDMITTVIRNLLTNALKFTNKCGNVEILVKSNNLTVDTIISDNGIGMDDDTISRLFRLDMSQSQPGTENETGTGLGLILCKEFIEKNGGTINVQSKPDEGSKFSFSLPKAT
jgi:signal transduction histidine kinase